MSSGDSISYKRNFLNQVIVRIDFASPIESIRDNLPKEIETVILTLFPILEPKILHGKKFQLTSIKENKDAEIKEIQHVKCKDWIFFGKDREKELHLNSNALFIIYKKYTSSSELKTDFFEITKTLFSYGIIFNIKRFGLRYINKIVLNDKNPLKWDKYLNKKLLCNLILIENSNYINRSFHLLEEHFNDIQLKFQYGLQNPDYPAPIYKKEFILDYDCSHEGLIQNFSELESYLNNCHIQIKKLFEICIKDGLRSIMNG